MRGERLFSTFQGIAVTVWVGSLWTTGALVAPVLFRMISDRTLAGSVAGHLFDVTAYIGLACAAFLITLSLIRHRKGVLTQVVFWLVLGMMVLVCLGQFGVQPELASMREQAFPEPVMQTEMADSFANWHAVSGILYLVESILGLALVAFVTSGKSS